MVENQDLCQSVRKEFSFPSYRLTMSAMYSVAAIGKTVLNSLILISIWKTPSLHKPSYILIGSLALSDLLVGAVGDPLIIINHVAVLKGWPLKVLCLVFNYARVVCYALASVSLLTLMFISMDRLLAVRLRNRYQSVVTEKRVILLLLTWWVISFAVSGILFGSQDLASDTSSLPFFGGIASLCLVSAITVCYIMAFYSLRKITSPVSPSVPSTEEVARPSSNIDLAKYRKSLVTMLVVFVLTIFHYTPFVCTSIISAFAFKETAKKNNDLLNLSSKIAEFVGLLNSAVNPLVYLWRIRDIRQAVKTTVKRALKIS